MWNLPLRFLLKNVFVRITVPLAVIAGSIGYVVEGFFSDRYTPPIPSIQDERQKRLLQESQEIVSLKEKKFIPKTIFEKNLSPSLLEEDTRGKKYEEIRS